MEELVGREEPLRRVLDELARRGYTEHFRAVDGGLEAYSDPTTSAALKDVPILGKTAA